MPANNNILKQRNKIDKIDKQILDLLNQRATISLNIRREKQDSGAALFDPKREEDIVEILCKQNKGPLFDDNIRKIFGYIMKVMRGLPDAE